MDFRSLEPPRAELFVPYPKNAMDIRRFLEAPQPLLFSKTFNPGASARDHRVMAQLRGGFNDVRMLHFSNDHAPSDVFSDYRPNPSHSGYDGGCLRRDQRSSCYEWQAAYDEMREKAGLTPAVRAYVAP